MGDAAFDVMLDSVKYQYVFELFMKQIVSDKITVTLDLSSLDSML